MTSAEHHLKTIFSAALECASSAERADYLDRACAGNPTLRGEIESLLEAHGRVGRFLEPVPEHQRPTSAQDGAGETTEFQADGAEAGAVIAGRYLLVEQISAGGMGIVWRAEQTEPVRREVALKVIKPGMDSRQVLARFDIERQALALMDHPHIAKVFDGGATAEGRPFFVMELVHGVPITAYCDAHRLPLRARLELFALVCDAVQHAHQKGIIHRDLKPTNVLVGESGGRAVPKVIDFGIAKATGEPLTDNSMFTGLGGVVGTPEYMSPEQAALNNRDIDTRSDIYSLGVLLYELLTGETPLGSKRSKETPLLELLRQVREEDPPRPSAQLANTVESTTIAANRRLDPRKMTRMLRGELDWIVMKCLEKDRNRRYATVSALAMDVQRYLTDEPVLACPPSVGYRLRKLVRRNRAQLVVVASLVLLLASGVAFGWYSDRQATAARAEADRRATQTEREATAALAEMAALLDRGGREIQNPPRWRLNLDAARSAHSRAVAALEAGPASDELREQVRAAGDRLAADEADCEIAAQCEAWGVDLVAGFERPERFPVAELRRRASALLDRVGVPSAISSAEARAAAIRKHRLRYQLCAVVLLANLVGQRRGDLEQDPLHTLAEELSKNVHPLQEAIVQSAFRGTTRAVLGEGAGRSATSAELVCLAYCLATNADVEKSLVAQLFNEALLRNPAELGAMTFHMGRHTSAVFRKIDSETGVMRLSSRNWRPIVLTELELQTLAAVERGLALRPDIAFLWVLSAESLRTSRHYGWAADRYRVAVRLDPADEQSHVRLAESLVNAGRVVEAVEAYRATLRAFPRTTRTTTSPIVEIDEHMAVRVAAARAALVLAHKAGDATNRLSAEEKRELRRDALRWLREWLTVSPPTGLDLFLVQHDPAFGPVRDMTARDRLPPDEQEEWRDLWELVRSARGTGHQRFAFDGELALHPHMDPKLPKPRDLTPPPRK